MSDMDHNDYCRKEGELASVKTELEDLKLIVKGNGKKGLQQAVTELNLKVPQLTDAVDVAAGAAVDIDSDILTGNITDNPLFKSNETFRLRPTSPAIDAGISVGLTHDYWGHRITGTPDMGACEFGNYVLFYNGKQLY